jgi:hypothetical protein
MKAKITPCLLIFPKFAFLDSGYIYMLKTRFLGSRLDQTTTTQLHKYTHPTIHLLRVSWVLNITKNSGLRGDVNKTYRSRV